ncbi:MAG: hypothetical protein R8G66_02130 [Cytophagales bacterium]|nr:hypothetical protein [Cytophagales bacterium]
MKLLLTFLSFLFLHASLSAQTNYLDQLKNLKVRSVGPANMSGRITTIDVVNGNQKIMYIGAASGGVWKSGNGGTRWDPVFDRQVTQNIGALAIQQDNPNVVWVGTGEGNPRNSMNLGLGIFKTTDGGESWDHMGLEKTKTIHRIIVHPRNGNVVFVGAMGDPFTPGPDRGLYKTTDGGETWEKILYTNDQSGVADMVMDPKDPNKMLVALYDHRRTPYSFVSGGKGSGLFMTYDGGANWTQLNEKNGLPSGELGRIGLAIAPSNPKRIYAKVEARKNALYRSEDGGLSWQLINKDPKYTNNRPFYFQELAVSSDNQDLLYNIYQPLSVSYDGGESFDPTPQIPADETKGVHADFHAFWMSPDDAEFYIIGGDGGIGITRDRGKSWYFPESIPVGQLYQVNVDEEMPYHVYGGLQDNGNWYGPGYVWRRGGIRTLYWQYLVGGDGFYISPDSEDSRFGYGTSQNGSLYRYDKTGGYYSSIKPPTPEGFPRLRFHWNAAFAQDPHDASTVYYGSQFVHVSKDRGKTWEVISPDLTTNNPKQQLRDYGGLTLDASGAEFYNCILAIAPSSINKDVMWVGTDDGKVQLSKDGGRQWKEVTKNIKGLPKGSWMTRIHASEYEEGTAWVVANNYRKGDYKPYLFKTEDFGQTWQPQVEEYKPVYGYALSFIQDPLEPNLLFLGTENGLWVSFDGGENWEKFRNDYPSVSTMDLKIQRRESALIIGTFGRAIWIIDDLHAMRKVAAETMLKNLEIAKINPVVQVKGIFINAQGNIWTGFHTTFEGDNRSFMTMQIPYFVKESRAGGLVAGTVYDTENRLIQRLAGNPPIEGLNYLEWQLDESVYALPESRYPPNRGIPVLPGEYKIVINYGKEVDSVLVEVIADPRFDFDPTIDEQLYQIQKELDGLRKKLWETFKELDRQTASMADMLDRENAPPGGPLRQDATDVVATVNRLKTVARGKPIYKQVGAWQSFQVTAFSKLKDAQWKFVSSHSKISDQELRLIRECEQLVNDFVQQFEQYLTDTWQPFVAKVREKGISWE